MFALWISDLSHGEEFIEYSDGRSIKKSVKQVIRVGEMKQKSSRVTVESRGQ